MLVDFYDIISDEEQIIVENYNRGDFLLKYENDIKAYSSLTKEQEIALFERYHQVVGEEKKKLRNEIAIHYLKFVNYVAKMYNNKFLSFEDVVSEGNIGLLKAIDNFDETKGIRFTTYSIYWIKSAITRNAYNQNRLITVPSYIEERLTKYLKYIEKYFLEYNVQPKREEISKQINISIQEILELEKILISPVSFNTPINKEGEKSGVLFDFIRNENADDPEKESEKDIIKYNIQEILNELTPQDREFILIRYGFYDNEKKSLTKTAQILYEQGYTKRLLGRESARLQEHKILTKLRSPKYIQKLMD